MLDPMPLLLPLPRPAFRRLRILVAKNLEKLPCLPLSNRKTSPDAPQPHRKPLRENRHSNTAGLQWGHLTSVLPTYQPPGRLCGWRREPLGLQPRVAGRNEKHSGSFQPCSLPCPGSLRGQSIHTGGGPAHMNPCATEEAESSAP